MSVTERNAWVQNINDDTQNYNYDGIDLDFESGRGTISTGLFGGFFSGSQQDLDQIALNIKALGAHFGPSSGTGKLFILDLNYVNLPSKFLKDIEHYIDYFFMQRYFGGQLDKLYNEAYKEIFLQENTFSERVLKMVRHEMGRQHSFINMQHGNPVMAKKVASLAMDLMPMARIVHPLISLRKRRFS